MSKPDNDGTSQQRDRKKQPGLSTTNWGATLPPQVRASGDFDNVSPRSQGEVPLNDWHVEEMRRKIEEAKERAKTSPAGEMPPRISESGRPAAAGPSQLTRSALHSVSPELLTELRKIIREEVEQLNTKGEAKEDVGDKSSRPSGLRDRPTSPVQSFSSAAGVNLPPTSFSKSTEEKRASPTATATASSPTKSQPKDSPRQSTVRFSNETKPAEPIISRSDETRNASSSNEFELTAIDKRWGVLFEKDGSHTTRMEQVIRGLAKYITEEFMPQRSIVITPEKMAAFYSHHRLEKEKFPFVALFKSKSKDFNAALSSLYEDLGCQYFLVPADTRSRPSIPGLTPHGFMHWLVTMIQAYPDEEAKRLDRVVSALPIEADSLLDGKPERLPKQISRYLLPKEPLRKFKRLVDEAIHEFKEDIEGSSTSRSKVSSSSSAGKTAPIIVTAVSDKRSSVTASSSANSRYVPDSAGKEARGDESGGIGYERDRRASTAAGSSRDMPPPPMPSKVVRTGSMDNSSRGIQSSREAYVSSSSSAGASSRVPATSSSSSRKNRSPQRKPYSQSVPSSLDRDDVGGDRFRSANISAAANNVAANILGSSAGGQSSSQNLPNSNPALDSSMRDARNNNDQYRDKRTSLDESASRIPTSAYGSRDKVELESSNTSRSSKRRSMVLPDIKGPTWDEYLKSSAPRSATPSFAKRDPGYHSSS